MDTSLRIVLDNYLFDFSPLKDVKTGEILLEAPQGFVRLLPRIASFLRKKLGVETRYRLEPSYGLCSVSLKLLDGKKDLVLVHLGHDFYPYPYCGLGGCRHSLPSRVVTVPGVYLGGDPVELAEKAASLLGRSSRVALGYSAQHSLLVDSLIDELRRRGVDVVVSAPILGCFFAPFLKASGGVDAFLVVAGGFFHALGLGLSLRGEARVYRVDPYSSTVEDAGGVIRRVLAKRYWAMYRFREAKRVAIIAGLLPGQYRPGIVDAVARKLKKKGVDYDIVYAERLDREMLDNLDPGSYDAYVVTSCPRLAVEDLGDYWKPVLAPGEAVSALQGGERYVFPW